MAAPAPPPTRAAISRRTEQPVMTPFASCAGSSGSSRDDLEHVLLARWSSFPLRLTTIFLGFVRRISR
jgi:hypothetical protein